MCIERERGMHMFACVCLERLRVCRGRDRGYVFVQMGRDGVC